MKNRKRLVLVLLYAALLSPWIVSGAIGALETNANSPLDWVDTNFEPRRLYDRFSDQFGAGDVVVISWPGCRIDEPRLDDFLKSLRESPGFHHGDQWLFHQVTCGRESLHDMLRPPCSLSPEQAVDRLQGSLIGPDGRTTCVVISFNEIGLKQRARLVPLIRGAAFRYCGAEYASQHLAGPIMDGHAVDVASQFAMNRYAPLSAVIVFCVCLLCLDSLPATLLVFGISVLAQAITLAILHYCGGTMTALLIVLPPLVQVLAIAGGIHLVNYYFDAAASSAAGTTAIAKALRTGWLPCVLSATTTAIGLGSLCVSGLVAVREFGTYAAVGVIATVAALLTFVPAVMALRPIALPKSAQRMRPPLWGRLTQWLSSYGGLTSFAAAVLMVGSGFGIARLQASVRIETLFGDESRLIGDYAWLEEHVGPLVPIEVVTRFDRASSLTTTERMELLDKIKQRLIEHPQIDAVTSCVDFLPELPQAIEDPIAQMVSMDELFERSKLHVSELNYLTLASDGAENWRTTAHASALGSADYGKLLRELTSSLETGLLQTGSGGEQSVSLELSGLMPLVHEIQQQLLRDLFVSFLTAFALIAIVMTIVQAGLWAGLLSMVPNVFPALTLFGILGWCGHPIDIGSIMTASVAMGIAVDDTLHFLTFFQRELDAGKSRHDAVLAAQTHCGRAIIQTTLICGAGLSVFMFSEFVPTARFAWMMVALLSAALVGDLIVLPGLLLGPPGKVFDARSPEPSLVAVGEETRRGTHHLRKAS